MTDSSEENNDVSQESGHLTDQVEADLIKMLQIDYLREMQAKGQT